MTWNFVGKHFTNILNIDNLNLKSNSLTPGLNRLRYMSPEIYSTLRTSQMIINRRKFYFIQRINSYSSEKFSKSLIKWMSETQGVGMKHFWSLLCFVLLRFICHVTRYYKELLTFQYVDQDTSSNYKIKSVTQLDYEFKGINRTLLS